MCFLQVSCLIRSRAPNALQSVICSDFTFISCHCVNAELCVSKTARAATDVPIARRVLCSTGTFVCWEFCSAVIPACVFVRELACAALLIELINVLHWKEVEERVYKTWLLHFSYLLKTDRQTAHFQKLNVCWAVISCGCTFTSTSKMLW